MHTRGSKTVPKSRREFMKLAGGAGLFATSVAGRERSGDRANGLSSPETDHDTWCTLAAHLARPVLESPWSGGSRDESRLRVTRLAATLHGLSPWLARGEQRTAREFASLACRRVAEVTTWVDSIAGKGQSARTLLPDCALLARALVRARPTLWDALEARTQRRAVDWFRSLASAETWSDEDRLFAAVLGVAIRELDGDAGDSGGGTIYAGLRCGYKGLEDGHDAVGLPSRWRNVRSVPAEALLFESLETVAANEPTWLTYRDRMRDQIARQATLEERLVAPDGTYPLFGRMELYGCGAFQGLAIAAWKNILPPVLRPSQARVALTAVIRRSLEGPGVFDRSGWLLPRIPSATDAGLRSNGSGGEHYLCTAAFLPLGLPRSNPFWSEPPQRSTWLQSWSEPTPPA